MVLHVRRVQQHNKEDLDEAYDLPGVKIELTGRLFVRGGLLSCARTNSPTTARHEDGLHYIKIWVTPPRRLVF